MTSFAQNTPRGAPFAVPRARLWAACLLAWFVLLGPPLLSAAGQDEASQPSQSTAVPLWHYNGFADVGYLLDFNHPSNHLFRSRGTTPHVDELDLNMAGAFLNKSSSEQSRWGMQLGVQGGKDSEAF